MTKKNVVSIFGWMGVSLILFAYALLSFDLIPKGLLYDSLNLVGAFLVVIDAIDDKAYPPAILNIIWFFVALASLIF